MYTTACKTVKAGRLCGLCLLVEQSDNRKEHISSAILMQLSSEVSNIHLGQYLHSTIYTYIAISSFVVFVFYLFLCDFDIYLILFFLFDTS